jgi:formate hydrogenlyase subunit 3/multisubunit Na+/H+ antiporter MnhD subunit
MLRSFIRNNVTVSAIILFIITFAATQYIKPAFLYKPDGSIREFGVGTKNKTILPVWLFSIILGILAYLCVLYYISYPKL